MTESQLIICGRRLTSSNSSSGHSILNLSVGKDKTKQEYVFNFCREMCDLKGRQQLLFIMHVKIGHVRLGELAGIGLRPGGWGEWWHTWKLIWLGLGDGVRQQPSSWSCHGGQSTPRRNSGASACSAYFAPVREHVKTSIFMQGTRLKYQRRGPEKNAYVRVRGIPAKECAKAHRPELQESSWEVSWWRSIILINFALIQSRGCAPSAF